MSVGIMFALTWNHVTFSLSQWSKCWNWVRFVSWFLLIFDCSSLFWKTHCIIKYSAVRHRDATAADCATYTSYLNCVLLNRTRRLAVDLATHCNIGLKRVCCHFESDVEMWMACSSKTALTVEVAVFMRLIAPKPYIPTKTYKRHILGMFTRPQNDSHCPKLWHLSCMRSKEPPSLEII